ncbi:unnamed protein product [Cuscuta campestris]|uniref:Uncharacterized protein n=1 Tax=Cuscuta campestris TaxID=132261 RepID=A0A484LZT9_9ASTE|nr:unnamed protein product [Cuscuta campestris]
MGSGRFAASDSLTYLNREVKNSIQSHSPWPLTFSSSSGSTPLLPVLRFSRDNSMKQQHRDKGLSYQCGTVAIPLGWDIVVRPHHSLFDASR